ncbi:hypothetical protein ABK040_012257 [Willaertia magna]
MFSKNRIQKQQENKGTDTKATASVTGIIAGGSGRNTGYQIRVQKDIDELESKWSENIKIEDVNKLNKMTLILKPDDGIWKNHAHEFEINIPNEYPIQPPKVICKTKVWHPNIDQNGAVCLNILRADWKPVLNLNAIFTGLHFLFLEPNPDDPLDIEAAKQYTDNYSAFKKKAENYMKGNYW